MTTYYIDPSASTNGDGSLLSPFNTWASVVWAAGNTYLQRAGSVSIGQITVGATGTANSPIVVGAYGKTKVDTRATVLVTTDATEGVRVSTRSYVTLQDFRAVCTVINPAGSSIGIHIRQACTNVKIVDCESEGFYYGLLSDNFNPLATSQNKVEYIRCRGINCWGSGFHCTNVCNAIRWKDCYASGNGFTTNITGGHGFTCIAERQNTFSWALVSGAVYKAPITLTNPLARIAQYTSGPSSLTLNAGAGPGATLTNGQYDTDATHVFVNVGVNPGSVSMQAYSNDLFDLKWEDCLSENSVEGYVGEGHGWMVDEGTINSTVRRCVARNNGYDGFQTARSINVVFESCVSYGNRVAGFRANSASSGAEFRNCTSVGNGVEGFVAGSIAETVKTRNCVAYKNGGQGFTLRATSTSDRCCSFANGSNDSGGTVTNKLTTDPLLSSAYRPLPGSPLIGAGTYVGNLLDKSGKRFARVPSIGAYEYFNQRQRRW